MWESLISHIAMEQRGGVDLVKVLEDMVDQNIFVANKRTNQTMMLEGALGEEHELVDKYLDSTSTVNVHHKHLNAFTIYHQLTTFCLAHNCIVTVHHTPPPHTSPQHPTLESRIEEYLLAPRKVKETEVLPVACYIFGGEFASSSDIRNLW